MDALNQSLMEATEEGKTNAMRLLLDQGADPNARVLGVRSNRTPLYQAVSDWNQDAAELLLNYGANPYLEDDDQKPVIFYAHGALLKLFLDWKAPINARSSKGVTALMNDITYASPGELQILLKYGADPNQRSRDGTTPLMAAAGLESGACAKVLLRAGAQLNAQDDHGNSALLSCTHLKANHSPLMELLEAGADVNLPNNEGLTPLMRVLGCDKELDKLLLERSPDFTKRAKDGTTTLMVAAESEALEMLKLAIAGGVDVNARNSKGETALSKAVSNPGDHWNPAYPKDRQPVLDMIKLLISAGADTQWADSAGLNLLHHACEGGFGDTVDLLLQKGLDPNRVPKSGIAPLHLAIRSRLNYESNPDALDKVRRLVAGGARVDIEDNQGHTPLWLAVTQMDIEAMTLLLGAGASVDHIDKSGDTLLVAAARLFHDEYADATTYSAILTALAFNANNVNSRDSHGMSPLMWAAASNIPSALEALLARHAEVNARSNDGRTALMWAAAAGAAHTIEILLKDGADPAMKDNSGRNASDWAQWMDQTNAVTLLKGKPQ